MKRNSTYVWLSNYLDYTTDTSPHLLIFQHKPISKDSNVNILYFDKCLDLAVISDTFDRACP